MAIYRYVKRLSGGKLTLRGKGRLNSRIPALLFMAIGFCLLVNAAYPIITYQLLISPRFSSSFVSPNTEAAIAQSFGVARDKTSEKRQNEILGTQIDLLDLTKASNWFPEKDVIFDEAQIGLYFLSIPKLGIEEIRVSLGNDLGKSLIQYPGTAVPGRFGNTVIFGHSVLPQFFNPKNYMTIFSTLPTLRPKDEIWISYNQVRYRYLVEQMIEVSPNDISILAQRYDDSYLTLITCVPPGTYLKRLIVRARLTKV